jgi:hypothetical protein
LWQRVDQEMLLRSLNSERQALADYITERPSTDDARLWLKSGGLVNIEVAEYPLEVETGAGHEFLYHPLLRGGFLEDLYECFTDQELAESFMQTISQDIQSFTPLIAQRGVMSGWHPKPSS